MFSLNYMRITTVSVSLVEKVKLLIVSKAAVSLFFQTQFLLKANFVKYRSCLIYGWPLRRLHANWVSMCFIYIYLLSGQGMYCGSYKCFHIFELTCLGSVTISEWALQLRCCTTNLISVICMPSVMSCRKWKAWIEDVWTQLRSSGRCVLLGLRSNIKERLEGSLSLAYCLT
jgi:hypothetical protein